jgi:hypothetical protein
MTIGVVAMLTVGAAGLAEAGDLKETITAAASAWRSTLMMVCSFAPRSASWFLRYAESDGQ